MKEKILGRIRALLNKTVANGCTEAEALSAATLAAAMMDAHGFAEGDLDERENILEDRVYFGGKHVEEVAFLTSSIAAYCDVRGWIASVRNALGKVEKSEIVYFGHESNVAVAKYLTELLHNAYETAWRDHFARNLAHIPPDRRQHGKTLRAAFMRGMTHRLTVRLREMKAARNAHVDASTGRTGQDLVVAKSREVEVAFQIFSQNKKFSNGQKRSAISNASAYHAGSAAADRVNITPGVSGKGKPLAIAGR